MSNYGKTLICKSQAAHETESGVEVISPMNHVCELTPFHRLSVARLMAWVQPELWNVQEALETLNSCQGWFLEDTYNGPTAWLAARLYPAHRSIEIETMGFNDGGITKIGPELARLIDACEDWAEK